VHFTRNIFAWWVNDYTALGPPLPPARAVQIVLPQLPTLRLDGPVDLLRAAGPNRAARRRRRRRPPGPPHRRR
jgi:hypothetical protein